ncbi:hypothetical protein PMAYCL1PPCAC_14883, partial [Pristionchus mayeri]
LMWPIAGSYHDLQSPFGNRGLSFIIISDAANIIYQATPVAIGACLDLVILVAYCVIVAKARKDEKIANAVVRTTIASVIMC